MSINRSTQPSISIIQLRQAGYLDSLLSRRRLSYNRVARRLADTSPTFGRLADKPRAAAGRVT